MTITVQTTSHPLGINRNKLELAYINKYNNMKAIRINHVTLLVNNKEKAEEFYINKLGLEKYVFNNHLWIKIGDQYIHITENSGEPRNASFYHFAIEIKNVQDYVKELVKKGIDVFDIDRELCEILLNSDFDKPLRQFFVRDSDKNLIEFIEAGSQFFNPT